MARAIQTQDFSPDDFTPDQVYWVYNGLDCMLTREIFDAIRPQADDASLLIYRFEQAMLAPAWEMMQRGMLVDQGDRERLLGELGKKLDWIKHCVRAIGRATWGKDLNPNSPPQVQEYFYTYFDLPKVYNFKSGKKSVSTDRAALEKLSVYFYARPMANAILAYRDVAKKMSTLRTPTDSDGRMRASYNPSATETGRWSSSKNAWGTGTNLQNQTEELRRVFVADPGMKLGYIDLEQAESRAVGLIIFSLFGDSSYLDACESGDLHTTVCKLIWDDLPWTGDLTADKALAGKPFYRHFSYRDMSKRGGHGTNYNGKPPTMAKNLKVDRELMENFQARYFEAFPGIPEWHKWTRRQVQLHGRIVTPLGRCRYFFGRGLDDATIREAIAYAPQSTVGDILNLGLWRLWYYLGNEIQVVGQVHDAVVFQYPEEREAELLPRVAAAVEVPITLSGRTMTIPTDLEVGWNWSHTTDENPDGLKKLKPGTMDPRTRQRPAPCPKSAPFSLLQRRVSL